MLGNVAKFMVFVLSFLGGFFKIDGNLYIECKYKKGRFIKYGKPIEGLTNPLEIALYYVQNISKAHFFAFPCVARRFNVAILFVPKEEVIKAIKYMIDNHLTEYGVFGIDDNALKIMRVEFSNSKGMDYKSTFSISKCYLEFTDYKKMNDIPKAENCENAPYARKWELITRDHIYKSVHVGGLKNNNSCDVVVVYTNDEKD